MASEMTATENSRRDRRKVGFGMEAADLTKLYSELIGRGYIKEIERDVCYRENIEIPYRLTTAGIERESDLARRHPTAASTTKRELRKDPRSTSAHLAFLAALTEHEWWCTGCPEDAESAAG